MPEPTRVASNKNRLQGWRLMVARVCLLASGPILAVLALEIGLTGKPIHVASVIPGAVATAIFDRANDNSGSNWDGNTYHIAVNDTTMLTVPAEARGSTGGSLKPAEAPTCSRGETR